MQCVKINDEYSPLANINHGVPQGSILGPLLFIIYINDIVCCSKLFNFILFADDTNLFMSDSNVNKLLNNINTELSKVSDWLCANKLSLNVNKTKYISFGYKYLSTVSKPPDIFY